MRVLLRKSPLCRKHFFEWLKTTVLLFDCGTSTLKSLLLLGSNAPHVHLRLRKRLSRCTLDCGFKTPESPALRGFEAERCPITGTSLYLAFFFVLEKAVKSAGNAVIPTFPCIGHTNFKGLSNAAANTPTLLLSMGISR